MAILLACWINPSYGFMSLTVPTADRGTYYSDGLTGYPLYHTFFIGWNGVHEGRSFFVYSLPGLDSGFSLSGAEIQLHINSSPSHDPPETVEFHEIGGAITNTSECFQDLADGALYGSTESLNSEWVSVSLNDTALNEMEAIMWAGGGMFMFGGSMSSLQYQPNSSEYIYGWIPAGGGMGGTAGSDLLLTVTTIPEPSSTALFCLGGLGLASRLFRRKHNGTKTYRCEQAVAGYRRQSAPPA